MASIKSTLTLELVNHLFRYDQETGKLYRRVGVSHSSVKAGDEVGSRKFDYLVVGIHGRNYPVHCIIWFIYYKKWPDSEIDHKDRNGTNNRIGNLRKATRQQNNMNRGIRKNSSTGYVGVSKSGRKFRAQIACDGKDFWLGVFATAEEAAKRYDLEAKKLYGEFAHLNFPDKGTIG